MKINIANPAFGAMKCIEVDDEKKLAAFYDKRMGQEVDGEVLGDEFAGYAFRITGGNDKEGFPMMQGVLHNGRVRLLLGKNSPCYRPRRDGERKRKSVRGCIVASDISVLQLSMVKVGEQVIPGLTDPESDRPRRLGPKRANNIRKLFGLTPQDDVRKYVIGREFIRKGKVQVKRPKIQRLVTPVTLQRKRARLLEKQRAREKAKREAAEYKRLLEIRAQERKDSIAKRRSSRKSSRKVAATA